MDTALLLEFGYNIPELCHMWSYCAWVVAHLYKFKQSQARLASDLLTTFTISTEFWLFFVEVLSCVQQHIRQSGESLHSSCNFKVNEFIISTYNDQRHLRILVELLLQRRLQLTIYQSEPTDKKLLHSQGLTSNELDHLTRFFLRKMLGTRYGSVGTRFLWF